MVLVMRDLAGLNREKAGHASVELLVAADDAGPGNYLGRIIDAWPGPSFFIAGRARKASLRTESYTETTLGNLAKRLASAQGPRRVIVTGTSFGDVAQSTDKGLVNLGSKLRVPAVSIVETWNLFRERFITSGGLAFPDFIIVNDQAAKSLAASAGLPNEKVLVLGNPIFEDLELTRGHQAFNAQSEREIRSVLFISEKIRDSWISTFRKYDEFSCLSELRRALPKKCQLVIKLHPEEEPQKYSFLAGQGVEARKEMSFSEMVRLPDKIVGMESTLLYELSIFRDDIISFIPDPLSVSVFDSFPNITCVSSAEELADTLSRSAFSFDKKIDAWRGSTEKIVTFLLSIAA